MESPFQPKAALVTGTALPWQLGGVSEWSGLALGHHQSAQGILQHQRQAPEEARSEAGGQGTPAWPWLGVAKGQCSLAAACCLHWLLRGRSSGPKPSVHPPLNTRQKTCHHVGREHSRVLRTAARDSLLRERTIFCHMLGESTTVAPVTRGAPVRGGEPHGGSQLEERIAGPHSPQAMLGVRSETGTRFPQTFRESPRSSALLSLSEVYQSNKTRSDREFSLSPQSAQLPTFTSAG